MTRPYEIVLTGGTAPERHALLGRLTERLRSCGVRALVVPDAGALLTSHGLDDLAHLAIADRRTYLGVHENMALAHNDLRQRFLSLADELVHTCPHPHIDAHDGPISTVLLYDRAELDQHADLEPAESAQVLRHALEETPSVVAARYDTVLDLGPRDGNTAPSPWAGHHRLVTLDASAGTEGILARALSAALALFD
jgi:hypothetical protein